jgi:hypothetical protein
MIVFSRILTGLMALVRYRLDEHPDGKVTPISPEKLTIFASIWKRTFDLDYPPVWSTTVLSTRFAVRFDRSILASWPAPSGAGDPSMTGGTPDASQINRYYAAAQETGVAMGLGSQRAAIEEPQLAYSFQVRQAAPDILLFANLGAVQLNYTYTVEQCQRAVDMISADALVLHLNALQEALQPEGDTRFSNLLKKIEAVCRVLPVPVIAKEVGWGMSEQTARRLASAGVAAIDVAGAGGLRSQ